MNITKNFLTALCHLTTVALAIFALVIYFGMQAEETPDRPSVPDGPSSLMRYCHPVPEGEFPGKALIRVHGGATQYVKSDRQVNRALEDGLGGKEWENVTILAFCK